MRLLYTFNDDRHAKTFTSFLSQQGIENTFELEKNTDWGNPEYGNIICRVWILEEDDLNAAKKHLEQFLKNPDDEEFKSLRPAGSQLLKKPEEAPIIIKARPPKMQKAPSISSLQAQSGIMTIYLIVICTALLFASLITSRTFEPYPASLPAAPLFLSSIDKALDYDYPRAYEIIDKLIKAYGFEKVIHPRELPPEGQTLLKQFYKTPYWNGVYDKLVSYFKTPGKPLNWDEPMFEKIREGQVWRLFTPCLLHAGIFHLLFNMIWLLVLGKQLEQKLSKMRYIAFIIITAVFSNTVQYLMSGSNFMGISGVLCAMIIFIWIRQRKSPWEGYHLLPSTMVFITGFVLIVFAVQVFSFFLEIFGHQGLSLPVANAAHIAGGFSGYILAQFKFFSWKL